MSDPEHIRRQLQSLYRQAADESRKDSDASVKAAKARERANRATSAPSMKMKLREAEREEQKALAARKKRAGIDKRIADLTTRLHQADSKVAADHARSVQELQDELRRQRATTDHELRSPSTTAVRGDTEFDFFISHASPDKDAIARPLKNALEAQGCTVWMDETQLRLGESLRQKIDDGLRRSRYGVVILSRSFLEGREWTERELNGLFVREEQAGEARILPVWHNVSKDEVASYSPILADKLAIKSADYTMDEMAAVLVERLGKRTAGQPSEEQQG